ncbi:hypothetical protein TOPH_00814, partial [Tolypocladium ophioglossoides CBS 100239]
MSWAEKPQSRPGPGACGRVSCERSMAIYWCNDSPKPKTLGNWGDIADAALLVDVECVRTKNIGGQVFNWLDWNVIVSIVDC